MGLRDLVYNARKNTPSATVNTSSMTKMIGDDDQTSTNLAPAKIVNWEDCKYLKKTVNHCLCTQFFVFCAREKCHKKYMK